jgi:WLM domain
LTFSLLFFHSPTLPLLILYALTQLTHNVHGPHDDKFYKLLATLEEEYDALRRSGYAGEGFHSKGQRLGADVSHNLPPHLARAKALEAAEKRRRMAGIMSGGRRLGGRVEALSPRELAAQVRILLSFLVRFVTGLFVDGVFLLHRRPYGEHKTTRRALRASLPSVRLQRLQRRVPRAT